MKGLEQITADKILDYTVPAVAEDDSVDPFKDLREEGEFSGGISLNSNINVVNDEVDQLCTICWKGDLMGVVAMNTIRC